MAQSAKLFCGVGTLLILGSLLPLGTVVSHSQWTKEDSTAYDRVSLEYKRSSFQDPEQLGLNEAEHRAQTERLKLAVDAMQSKLRSAHSRGELWSQRMWWVGLAATMLGVMLHLTAKSRSA